MNEDSSQSGKHIALEDVKESLDEEEDDREGEEDEEDLKDVDIDYISSDEEDEGDDTQNFAGHSMSGMSNIKERSLK